jgi:hypothetical protein
MTIGTADVSITLNAHNPKKDAVIALLVPTVGANDIAIWCGASVNQDKVQDLIGTWQSLLAFALSNMPSGNTLYAVEPGGGDSSINQTPGALKLQLYIGADIAAKQQSHFLDRTTKRLLEAWLEGPTVVT